MTTWLPILGLALTVGAPAVKDPRKAEVPSIVGQWEVLEFIAQGQATPADQLAKLKIRYEFTADGKMRAHMAGTVTEATYTTDATKEPAEIDITSDKTGKTSGGIYKLDKDILIVCSRATDKRPTRFESGVGLQLVKFKRVEKKKE